MFKLVSAIFYIYDLPSCGKGSGVVWSAIGSTKKAKINNQNLADEIIELKSYFNCLIFMGCCENHLTSLIENLKSRKLVADIRMKLDEQEIVIGCYYWGRELTPFLSTSQKWRSCIIAVVERNPVIAENIFKDR